MSSIEDFWVHQQKHSRVKSEIVAKYFDSWARALAKKPGQLTYVDLFAGRGKYKDGALSTPLLIMDKICTLPELVRNKLVLKFCDADLQNCALLEAALKSHSAYKLLPKEPVIEPQEWNAASLKMLRLGERTLSLIDPYGFKELSIEMVAGAIDSWGSDCIFYFSVSGVNRNLDREDLQSELIGIFGENGVDRLKTLKHSAPFHELVAQELSHAIRTRKSSFVLPFALEEDERRLVSQYLVFVSKNSLGFHIMKDIMGRYSQTDLAGTPLYRWTGLQQLALDLKISPEELMDRLCTDFRKRTITVRALFEQCHQMHYMEREQDIRSGLKELERTTDRIAVTSPRGQRKKGTFAEDFVIQFR